MIGAIWSVKWKMGFIGGYEFDLMFLAIGLGIAFGGPGKYVVWNYHGLCAGSCKNGTCHSCAEEKSVSGEQVVQK